MLILKYQASRQHEIYWLKEKQNINYFVVKSNMNAYKKLAMSSSL